MRVVYQPGGWLALAGPAGVALTEAGADRGLVASLWEVVRQGGRLADAMGAAVGTGARSQPPALALLLVDDDGARLAARGALGLAARGGGRTWEVNGAGAAGWREAMADAPELVRLAPVSPVGPAGLAEPGAGRTLELVSGMVLADTLTVEIEPTQAVAVSTPVSMRPDLDKPPISPVWTARSGSGEKGDGAGGAWVLGRKCACGAANPPRRSFCWSCREPLTGMPAPIARPALGHATVTPGGRHDLDRPMVIGRKPGSARFDPANAPALVTVPSPREEISKSHLGIVLEEWRVLVVDLGATNGTVLRRPGAAHRRLGRLEEVLAKNGDVFDLGEGVTVEIGGMP